MLDDSPYFRMIELDEIDSTNNFLKGYHPLNPVDVTLVTTEYQTAGRGQQGNTWEAERGQNLLFSLLLSALLVPASESFVISEAIALAIREALIDELRLMNEEYHQPPLFINHQSPIITVKWPNDIYIGDCKIAGILIENDLCGQHISRSIIGCGVNINQQHFLFPTLSTQEGIPTPVSLYQLLGKVTERRFVLETIMEHFMHHYEAIQRGDFEAIHAAYRAALYHCTGAHLFRDSIGVFEASIEGVEPTGHLLLRDSEGHERRYAFKEVAFLS